MPFDGFCTSKKSTGNSGEALAAEFLAGRGFYILERNYRAGRIGEIDIIARKDNLIVFVEVKTRSTDAYGGGIHAITGAKLKNLTLSARQYLQKNDALSKECDFRFDCITVENGEISLIEDIIRR